MANIRKIRGKKVTTYQVRYASRERKSGLGYSTFSSMKEARDFVQNLGTLREAPAGQSLLVTEAIDQWLAICNKTGRDGRESVEPETFKEYDRRARVMKEYAWRKTLHELTPADVIQFRQWLLENKNSRPRKTDTLILSLRPD